MIRNLTLSMLLLALVGCASATPTATPGVEKLGQTTVRYRGPQVEVVVGTRFADANIGDAWLLLDLAVTGSTGAAVEIPRDAVFVRTPSGRTVHLATQEEFNAAYGDLQAMIARANVATTPVDLYTDRRPCNLAFFSAGNDITKLSAWVDDRTVCSGRMYFEIPGGVQPGPYTLGIDLPESSVRVPFTLGERP